jgi:nucleoside-diphosphate-sugar epimerase
VIGDDLPGRYDGVAVAVTGAYGYIGAALVAALRETSARVLLVSRTSRLPVSGTEALTADVQTSTCWTEILRRADIVFHLAGNTSVRVAAANAAASWQSTVLPITLLAGAASRGSRRPPRVVYASTATVYGITESLPVCEETDPKPATTYDAHKLEAERELKHASRHGLVEGVSLRLANVYGPSTGASAAAERGVLNRVARLALAGDDIAVYGGGCYLRDYVYIDDVVRALLMTGVQPQLTSVSLNVGSGAAMLIRDAFQLVADRTERMTARRVRLQDAPWPPDTDPIEFRSFVADIERIGFLCGWRPTVSLPMGVDRLLQHVRHTSCPTTNG